MQDKILILPVLDQARMNLRLAESWALNNGKGSTVVAVYYATHKYCIYCASNEDAVNLLKFIDNFVLEGETSRKEIPRNYLRDID